MPLERRGDAATSISASGRGPAPAAFGAQRARVARAAVPARPAGAAFALGASAALFHAPHAGQRPNQRGVSWPQAEQKKLVLGAFAMGS